MTLAQAAARLLRECDARSYSSHPMAYTIPWKQALDLHRTLNKIKKHVIRNPGHSSPPKLGR